eukprot:6204797-Pleurochrysis_carterae.AAC.1
MDAFRESIFRSPASLKQTNSSMLWRTASIEPEERQVILFDLFVCDAVSKETFSPPQKVKADEKHHMSAMASFRPSNSEQSTCPLGQSCETAPLHVLPNPDWSGLTRLHSTQSPSGCTCICAETNPRDNTACTISCLEQAPGRKPQASRKPNPDLTNFMKLFPLLGDASGALALSTCEGSKTLSRNGMGLISTANDDEWKAGSRQVRITHRPEALLRARTYLRHLDPPPLLRRDAARDSHGQSNDTCRRACDLPG